MNNTFRKYFDSRLDLISRCCIPSEFDPSHDTIRFVTSSLSHYIEHNSSKVSDSLKQFLKSFTANVNSSSEISFSPEDGLISEMEDTVRVFLYQFLKKKSTNKNYQIFIKDLFESRYYQLIGILLHQTPVISQVI